MLLNPKPRVQKNKNKCFYVYNYIVFYDFTPDIILVYKKMYIIINFAP
jgi:hypothetical protein